MAPSTFADLPLSPAMRAALRAASYVTPTPIQAATIPPALAGRDVIGAAQTGTGKTASFMIPIVERLRGAAEGGRPRGAAVVLAPTRELAEQIHGWASRLGTGLKTALVVGGVAYGPQIAALRGRPAIVIATPGRLVDHLERKTLALADVRIFVLDEADRMLDMGFRPQLDAIMRSLPAERQTLLFSATMPPDLGALARMHLRNPARVAVGPQAAPPPKAAQDVYLVANAEKTPLLLSMVATNPGTVLVFARTKHRTDRVMRSLCDAGFAAQRLHSNRTQQQRRDALEGFRRGRYRVLVATDIAARGIDVADIRHVINYDLPMTVEDYVHRVGRTARAEAHGRATSFASPEERGQLRAIERHIGRALPRGTALAPTALRPAAPTPHRAPRPVAPPALHRAPRQVAPSAPQRAPRPGDARAAGSPRETHRPFGLADLGLADARPERRPSARVRRARRP
ncbi:MAG: DEAD/DEAH box helicase [Deltaproteobacteria bacterium]|nr:DEAD/DEAH box helicase [Deltaproteobacteria bacterium]